MVNSSRDITPEVAVAKRKEMGLSMRQFWARVHVTPSSASHYESGKTKGIPAPVRELVFLAYYIGIPMQQTKSAYKPLAKAMREVETLVESHGRKALAASLAEDAANLGITLTAEQIEMIEAAKH